MAGNQDGMVGNRDGRKSLFVLRDDGKPGRMNGKKNHLKDGDDSVIVMDRRHRRDDMYILREW